MDAGQVQPDGVVGQSQLCVTKRHKGQDVLDVSCRRPGIRGLKPTVGIPGVVIGLQCVA